VHSRLWIPLVALLAVAFLGACSRASAFLLYMDPYEFALLNSRGIDGRAIRQLFPQDLEVRIEVPPTLSEQDQALQHFHAEVERMQPQWVYLGPAHPFPTKQVAARFPQIQFFREGSGAGASANRVAVIYDREQANYEAGRAVARLLEDPGFVRHIRAPGEGRQPLRVGILVAVSNEKVEREISRFVEGFSGIGAPEGIERKDIGNITDRVKTRRLLDGMREQAVAIVFLKTYVLSGFCLEYLAKEGGLAVVEEAVSQQAYGNTVLLMLVDDFLGAVEGMVSYVQSGSAERDTHTVTAPVELEWGESYRSLVKRALEGVNRQ
jgi:hypothetical protein